MGRELIWFLMKMGSPIVSPTRSYLTQIGVLQAQAAANKIKQMMQQRSITKVTVMSSPFLRCIMTAAAVSSVLGAKQVKIDSRLS